MRCALIWTFAKKKVLAFKANSILIQLGYFIIHCLPLKPSNTYAAFVTVPELYWLGKEQALSLVQSWGPLLISGQHLAIFS